MSARRKLNQLHATGAVVVAGWLGLAFQSWWAFAAVFSRSSFLVIRSRVTSSRTRLMCPAVPIR